MRYFIDTNILIFLLKDETDPIDTDVLNLIIGYDHQVHTSAVCIQELIHLYHIGKFKLRKKESIEDVFLKIENMGFIISPIKKRTFIDVCSPACHL